MGFHPARSKVNPGKKKKGGEISIDALATAEKVDGIMMVFRPPRPTSDLGKPK